MVTHRLARLEDAEALAVVRQKAWAGAYRGIYPDEMIDQFDYADHTRRFRRQLQDPKLEVYILEDRPQAVGYLTIGLADWYRNIPVCLHSLYLIPEYHRKGIGKHMMEFTKDWCRQRGYTSFFNSCNLHNHKARAFYKAMGGVLGEIDDGNDDPAADQCYYEYTIDQ